MCIYSLTARAEASHHPPSTSLDIDSRRRKIYIFDVDAHREKRGRGERQSVLFRSTRFSINLRLFLLARSLYRAILAQAESRGGARGTETFGKARQSRLGAAESVVTGKVF
jgi:hypothetical protein